MDAITAIEHRRAIKGFDVGHAMSMASLGTGAPDGIQSQLRGVCTLEASSGFWAAGLGRVVVVHDDAVSGPFEIVELAASRRPQQDPGDHAHQDKTQGDEQDEDVHN